MLDLPQLVQHNSAHPADGLQMRPAIAGAGIQRGLVYGSSTKDGGYPETNPVRPDDLSATIFERLDEAGDLFAGVLEEQQDLDPVLDRLGIPPSRKDVSGGRMRRKLPPRRPKRTA